MLMLPAQQARAFKGDRPLQGMPSEAMWPISASLRSYSCAGRAEGGVPLGGRAEQFLLASLFIIPAVGMTTEQLAPCAHPCVFSLHRNLPNYKHSIQLKQKKERQQGRRLYMM